jgi:hypothetical protein
LVVYRSPDGQSLVQLRAVAGTVWLAQAQIAALYDTSVPNIVQLIRRILEDGEVSTATINSELRVQTEGTRQVRREVKIYNLDMVLAVGYRVTTPRAVQFRQWATTVLREYLVKGFVLDDPRLKDSAGTDYFDELLHRSGTSGRPRSASIRRSGICSPPPALTTTAPPILPRPSSPRSRTSSSSPSPVALRPSSSCGDRTHVPRAWD